MYTYIGSDRRLLSSAACDAKRCRRAERRFHRIGLADDKLVFVRAREVAQLQVDASRAEYLGGEVTAAARDSCRFWRTTKRQHYAEPPLV